MFATVLGTRALQLSVHFYRYPVFDHLVLRDEMLGINEMRKTQDRRGSDCPDSNQTYVGIKGECMISYPSEKYFWWCIEFMAVLSSTSVRESSLRIQTSEEIRTFVPNEDDVAASLEEK